MSTSNPTQQINRKGIEVKNYFVAEAGSRKKMNFTTESYKHDDNNLNQRASDPQRPKTTIPVDHPMSSAFKFVEQQLAEARQKCEALEHQVIAIENELVSALARLSRARAEEDDTKTFLEDLRLMFIES